MWSYDRANQWHSNMIQAYAGNFGRCAWSVLGRDAGLHACKHRANKILLWVLWMIENV